MVNQEQLTLLKTSITEWNRWRKAQIHILPDLTLTNLREADLSEADLSEANVSKSLLVKANLSHTRFVGTCLDGSDLRCVQAQGAYFSKASLKNADLRDAHFEGATLYRTNLNGAWLYASGLEVATLQMTGLPNLIKKKSL